MSHNQCDCDGWLVGAAHEIPSDPFDFSWGVQGPVIGCNNLRCERCDQVVRSAPGHTWGKQTLARRADVYDHIDTPGSDAWRALVADGAVATSEDERIYACGCNVHVEPEQRAMAEPADWDDDAPRWRCAGHPRVTLPATIDGVAVTTATDAADALVAAHLLGGGVTDPPAFVRDYPAAWIHRLLHLTRHTGLAAALGDAVSARLTSPDPAERAAAIDVFRRDAEAPGAEAVVAALRDDPTLFVGVQNPQALDKNLDEWLQVAVAHRAAGGDTEALAAIQDVALHAIPAQSLLKAIAKRSPTWLRDNAADVLRAHPSRTVARRLLYVMAPALGDELVAAAIDMGTADLIPRPAYLDLVRQLVKDDRGARITGALT